MNTFLYEIWCVIVPIAMLIPWTVDESQLRTGNRWTEALLLIGSVLIVFLPLISASFLNRLFYGKLICVLTDKGIEYDGGLILWKNIERIEFEYDFPHMMWKQQFCKTHIITSSGTITLMHAPYFLLAKAKKYKADITTSLSREGIIRMLTTPTIVLIFLCIFIFL